MMRFPEHILKQRLSRLKEELARRGIDAIMVRTRSTFTYLTGTKWLRPALLVPVDGEPIAFIAKNEEEGFLERTWIRSIVTYTDGGDLMAKVSGTIRGYGYKVMGLDYSLDRDAYAVFYEMFRRLNPTVKVVDVGQMIMEMRMIKDEHELNAIRQAGRIAVRAMERVLSAIEEGVSETDIAAEAYSVLYRQGSEEPHVYVNIGPNPRIHAEPFRDNIARKGVFVTVTIGADYNWYYANMTRIIFVGEPEGIARRAIECTDEIYSAAKELTKGGVKFIDIMKKLDKIYAKYELVDHRVIGYVHGVGLQIEETPITTILPRDRFMQVKPGMAIALVHAPIVLKGYGQVKREDTFIVREDGILEPVTHET